MSTLYRLLAWGGVALALIIAAGIKGYTLGNDHATAKYLTAQAQANNEAAARYARQVQHGNDLAAELAAEQQLSDQSIQALRQEVHRVTIHTVTLPNGKLEALAPLPLTRGTVCVYNRAWTGSSVPDSSATPGTDASPACTVADATQSSEFTESDWLDTDLTNAGTCRSNSAQLAKLIVWVKDMQDGQR